MSIATETAAAYFDVAAKAAESGHISQAIYYGEKALDLLLREEGSPCVTIVRDFGVNVAAVAARE